MLSGKPIVEVGMEKNMRTTLILAVCLFAAILSASAPSDTAIRDIIKEEDAAWNRGDTDAYSAHFAADGTFTNILGMFFTGHQAFRDRHEDIFKGIFRGTTLRQDIVSIKFVRENVAIVETLTWVSGFSKSGPPPGTHLDTKGRLCTRLLQVFVRDGDEWKIATYHNVDVKPGTSVPEPQ
jgi:uncharacterized protein (TIGR02246 family)